MIDFVFDDGGRLCAGYSGTGGDCVARAVAIAAQLPYQQVYDALASGNATERRTKRSHASTGKHTASHGISTTRKWFKDFMRSLGFEWVPTMNIGQGCKVHLRADELPMGRLVVLVSKHYCSVIDRVVHDTYLEDRDGTRCVYGYWQKV